MKRLILILIFVIAVTSCSKEFVTEAYVTTTFKTKDFIDLEMITVGSYQVCVDKNSDVLYVTGAHGRLSPIMKPNGTCLTLEEWEQNHKVTSKTKIRAF